MARARGFTLIEAVAVIVVTGIIAAVVAVFVTKPVQGYVDVVRRAALTDMADGALRRIGRDVRSALPNSVRVSGNYVEFIPTQDGIRYRVEQTSGSGDTLDFTAADTTFEVFGNGTLSASRNDYAVIFNTGQCSVTNCNGTGTCVGANAYEGCNRTTLSADPTYSSGNAFSLTIASKKFPFDSPDHRVHIVPSTGPVTYGCEAPTAAELSAGVQGSLVLHRYSGYGWNASQATPPSGSGVLVVDSVDTCTFTYAQGVTMRSGLLTLKLTLTRSGESVTLYHEIHIDNQP